MPYSMVKYIFRADIMFTATQPAKYLRVLYVKPSNKVYILMNTSRIEYLTR